MSLYKGLFVKASGTPDLYTNWSEGLIGRDMTFVSAGSALTTVVATKGKVVSGSSPATDDGSGLTFSVNVDGDGAQSLTTSGSATTGALIAAEIQAAVRAFTANTAANQASINAFTCVYTTVYTLSSGSTGAGSSVAVTGAGSLTLKLRTADGGTATQGISSVCPSGYHNLGILQINATGTVSLKWGTPLLLAETLTAYPAPDAGYFALAQLFTPSAPLLYGTTAINNSDINNRVLDSEFGGR